MHNLCRKSRSLFGNPNPRLNRLGLICDAKEVKGLQLGFLSIFTWAHYQILASDTSRRDGLFRMIPLSVALRMDQGCDQPADAETRSVSKSIRFEGPPLLPLVAAGELSAVDRFVERYGGLIWAIARKTTRSSHDAEDLVQEIFLDLWKNAAAFQSDRGSEVAFVAVVARRRVVDRIRKRSSAIQVVSMGERSVDAVFESGADSLEVADEVFKVRSCLENLSTNTQEVLLLILQEGMSHQEVAASTNIPLGSVKSYARRGLLFLRDCVNRPRFSTAQEAGA